MLVAPASDDEGSTAATDGSTLRTSPAEHGGSVGSESGGSAIDSVAGEHSGESRRHTAFKQPNNERLCLYSVVTRGCIYTASQKETVPLYSAVTRDCVYMAS